MLRLTKPHKFFITSLLVVRNRSILRSHRDYHRGLRPKHQKCLRFLWWHALEEGLPFPQYSECHKYHISKHIARVCRSTVKMVHTTETAVSTSIYDTEDTVNVFTLTNSSHLHHSVQFPNRQSLEFIVDTGSPVEASSSQLWNSWRLTLIL